MLVDLSLHEIHPRFFKLVYSNERSIRTREQPNVVVLVAALVAALETTIAGP